MLTKTCACKGIRTCLQCDSQKCADFPVLNDNNLVEYIYCWKCGNKAFLESHFEAHFHSDHSLDNSCDENNRPSDSEDNRVVIPIDGVFVQEEILSQDEEASLIQSIDSFGWVDSQSGRRKKDFGPKINFKKKKVNFTNFSGLPRPDMTLLDRIKKQRLRQDVNWSKFDNINNEEKGHQSVLECIDSSENILHNFKTVEVCHLEYCPERGSSIDPHFDDFWIWGERLVTLNLLSSTVITLTLKKNNQNNNSDGENGNLVSINHCIRVNLPPRSILVLYGDSRYRYEHSIRRLDITSRRLAITYRELPLSFLRFASEDYEKIGKEFIARAEMIINNS